MVLCGDCHVENAYAQCGNTPRLCYACCIKPGVATCIPHYHSLPIQEQQSRLNAAAALAAATAALAAGGQPPPLPAVVSTAPPADPNGGPPPGPDVQPAPQAQVPSIEASLAALTILVTTLATRLSAFEAHRQLAAAAVNVVPSLPLIPAPMPTLPAVSATIPPAHRQTVLNPSLSAAALTNLYNNLEVDSDDDDATQERKTDVSTQLTHSTLALNTVFPPSLATAPIGSAEDGQQQLARLLSAFHKTSSTVKYATLAELGEAIDDWYRAASKANWPQKKLTSIYNYRGFVIDTIGRQASLAHAVKYHTLFANAVQAGEHDLFALNGHFNVLPYITVFPSGGSASTTTAASKGDKKSAKDKKKGGAAGKDKTFAAGSCTNHPLSTTHDTSMCKKK
jgi:hypothetical protein